MNAVAGNGFRDAGGSDVFGDIALLQPHHDDFLDAGLCQRLDFARTNGRAFLQHQRALAQRMHGDAANRVGRTGGPALPASWFFPFFRGNRSSAGILAIIVTAISDGDPAPALRAIAARMRASSRSEGTSAL